MTFTIANVKVLRTVQRSFLLQKLRKLIKSISLEEKCSSKTAFSY